MYNFGYNRFGGTPPVVLNIIIICALMLFGTYVVNSKFGIDLADYLGIHYYLSQDFRWYQFITYLFMHGDFFHLLFNMFAFWMFGKILEEVWGSKRFLIFFLVTGIGAALIQQLVNYIEFSSIAAKIEAYQNTPSIEAFEAFLSEFNLKITDPSFINNWQALPGNPEYIEQSVVFLKEGYQYIMNISTTVGASGAVYGVLLGFGMLFPNTELMLLFPPIPIKAKYMVIAYGAIELFFGLTQPGSNIAHFAHLGGMLFGFILIKIWSKSTTKFY
jgi:membrane associated rhomboid family serine protease